MTVRRGYPTSIVFLAILLSGVAFAQDSDQRSIRVLNPLSKLDPLSLKAFLQRPLFSPDRKAPEDIVPQTIAVAENEVGSLNIRLLGVIVTPEVVIARVIDDADGKPYSLRKDDDFQDWTVISIDAGGLKLGKDGEIKTFTVFAKTSSAPDVQIAAEQDIGMDKIAAPETSQPLRKIAKARSQQQDLIDVFGSAKGDSQTP